MNASVPIENPPLRYMEGPCVICAELGHRSNLLAESALCALLASNDDALPDSAIIVPKRHAVTPLDLTVAEWMETQELLRQAAEWLTCERRAGGFTLGWNCTPVGGQSVPHAHMHVIARHESEGLTRGRGIRGMLKRPAMRVDAR